ncbi:MAG: sugar phosphate isomerase/epimerase [Archaeoglobaceae archaeon]|nr:sugar phosphate isomerase/epimerase [Archaeoglobaceae archaeon]
MIGTSVWYGHRPFKERFKKLIDLGFEYFEISMDFPFPEEGIEIEKIIKEFNIRPAFHAPIEILLASPRNEIFDASKNVLEKCLKFIEKFDPIYFNFHVSHLTPTFIFPEIRQKGLKNFEDAAKLLLSYSEEVGFEVCIENDMFFSEDFVFEGLKVTLDVGHLVIDSKRRGEDYKSTLKNFCKKYGKKILVSHLHDVDLESSLDHLPLGDGDLDLKLLKWFLERIKPKYISLEIFWKVPYKIFATDFELEKSLKVLKSFC